MPFREVYRARRTSAARRLSTRLNATACDGVSNPGGCYFYAAAGLSRAADGAGMTTSIQRPDYRPAGGPGHTLDELAVQGNAGDGDIVEIGWIVSTDMNGDGDPRLFVFHWKNWNPTCYNACGWVQYSNVHFPGQNIAPFAGRDIYLGYVFFGGNWWAWFDNQWLGYFPGSEWQGAYTKAATLQWFGEVATQTSPPAGIQMGDGLPPSDAKAARMSQLCDVDAAKWTCPVRDQQWISATIPQYYDIRRASAGAVRYGGPGK
jgi:Neprosin